MIPNPEYKEEALESYTIGGIGFDVWQVKAGTLFDNVMIANSLQDAFEHAQRVLKEQVEKEKEFKAESDKEEEANTQHFLPPIFLRYFFDFAFELREDFAAFFEGVVEFIEVFGVELDLGFEFLFLLHEGDLRGLFFRGFGEHLINPALHHGFESVLDLFAVLLSFLDLLIDFLALLLVFFHQILHFGAEFGVLFL
jgi:hypothetical protein